VSKIRTFHQEMDKKYRTEMTEAKVVSFRDLRDKFPNLPEFAEYDAYTARVLDRNGKVEVTLRLASPPPSGWLDRVLDVQVPPLTLTLQAPDFDAANVGAGELVRVRSVNPGT
jgi:hypothetical protein